MELSSPSDDTIKITHCFASYADGRVTAQGASPVLICHLDFGVDNSRLQTLTIKFIGTSLECVSWEISLSLWTSGSLVQLSWSLNGRLAHPFFVVQPLSARRPPKFEFSDGILSQSDCALYLRKLFGIVESIVCVCKQSLRSRKIGLFAEWASETVSNFGDSEAVFWDSKERPLESAA